MKIRRNRMDLLILGAIAVSLALGIALSYIILYR